MLLHEIIDWLVEDEKNMIIGICALIMIVFFILFIIFGCQHKTSIYIKEEVKTFDDEGYDRAGYTIEGLDRKGRYNRMYDRDLCKDFCYTKDGFLSVISYPVCITTHGRERITERLHIVGKENIRKQVYNAYSFGKSKRQIKKSSAALLEEIETRNETQSIALIYQGYIYLFSKDNVLITVYKNENIPL